MSSCSLFRSMRLATLAASLGLLGACASTGGGKPSAQVNALYSQLDQASKVMDDWIVRAMERREHWREAEESADAAFSKSGLSGGMY